MKFIVTRSNVFPGDNPKCPGIEKELVERDGDLEEGYTIEINTIEELLQFSKKIEYPIIVFDPSAWGYAIPELEIYDGYRE